MRPLPSKTRKSNVFRWSQLRDHLQHLSTRQSPVQLQYTIQPFNVSSTTAATAAATATTTTTTTETAAAATTTTTTTTPTETAAATTTTTTTTQG